MPYTVDKGELKQSLRLVSQQKQHIVGGEIQGRCQFDQILQDPLGLQPIQILEIGKNLQRDGNADDSQGDGD